MLAIPSDKNTFAIFCGISRDAKLQASQMNIPTKPSTSEGSISPSVNQSGSCIATTRMLLMTTRDHCQHFLSFPCCKETCILGKFTWGSHLCLLFIIDPPSSVFQVPRHPPQCLHTASSHHVKYSPSPQLNLLVLIHSFQNSLILINSLQTRSVSLPWCLDLMFGSGDEKRFPSYIMNENLLGLCFQ